ncbi:hypothetical protein DFQ26_007580 [Actinomortierella ambigua]|nr:hypothetical protein DFQ26_007580 [Actinomortierella ambigua]
MLSILDLFPHDSSTVPEQLALRDCLRMDPQKKLQAHDHHWRHFERENDAFRPDLWARMVIHYCPTLQHLESFFKCIHLNQTIIPQRQGQQQRQAHDKEQQEMDNTPLVIILAGFFAFDAVSKDMSTVAPSTSMPHSATSSTAGGAGGVDRHRVYLKLVSQVMSEVKDAMQWMEKSL